MTDPAKFKCHICGEPGESSHFPGPVPYTGSWCERHLQALRAASATLVEQAEEVWRSVPPGEDGNRDYRNYTWVSLVQTDGGWQEKARYSDRCWAIANTAAAMVKTGLDHRLQVENKTQRERLLTPSPAARPSLWGTAQQTLTFCREADMSRNQTCIDEIQGRYVRTFEADSDYIPLIVSPPCPGQPSRDERQEQPEMAARKTAAALAPKVAVGSDWIPSINMGWFQCIVVPSFFGACPVFPDGSDPIVEPCFRNVHEAVQAGRPSAGGPVLEQMLSILDTALRSLPEGFALSFPPTASPFDLAQLLLPGEEFLVALLSEPDETLQFLYNLADLCTEVILLTRSRLAGTASEFVTNRGIHFPGLRLACDALVNFSPDPLAGIALPVLQRLAAQHGKLCIHYCSKPAPSSHVLPVLAECECIAAVDTWQGPDAFIGSDAPARMQDRVGLIFDADLTSEERMISFLESEPIRDVPRKGGRPLVLHTSAASVDEGQKIFDMWQAKMGNE